MKFNRAKAHNSNDMKIVYSLIVLGLLAVIAFSVWYLKSGWPLFALILFPSLTHKD